MVALHSDSGDWDKQRDWPDRRDWAYQRDWAEQGIGNRLSRFLIASPRR